MPSSLDRAIDRTLDYEKDYENDDLFAKSFIAGATFGGSLALELATRWGVEAYRGHKGRKKQRARALHEALVRNPRLVDDVTLCVQKLAAAITGTTVQSILSMTMAHNCIGAVINGMEVVWQIEKLSLLKAQGALAYASSSKIFKHVALGIFLKLIFTFITLGHSDFIPFINQLMNMVHDSGMRDFLSKAGRLLFDGATLDLVRHFPSQITEAHRQILENPIGGALNRMIEMPTDAVKEYRHLPEDWNQHEFQNTVGHLALHNIVAVGTVSGLVDTTASRLVEEPTHKFVQKATLRTR